MLNFPIKVNNTKYFMNVNFVSIICYKKTINDFIDLKYTFQNFPSSEFEIDL